MTVRVIYENGVFRPLEAVRLPEHAVGEVVLPSEEPQPPRGNFRALIEAMSKFPPLSDEDAKAYERRSMPSAKALPPTCSGRELVEAMREFPPLPPERWDAFERAIEEACEQIDPEDFKLA